MIYSAAISEAGNTILAKHLIRDDKQEDLCFALYSPSTGNSRFSGLIKEIIIPKNNERNVHGNVSFNSNYFDRVTKLALESGLGICFMHSHPFPGWQRMSEDDVKAEKMLAPRVKAITGLPLLGMTIGSDETWSARFWIKSKPKTYERFWCHSVRIVGKGFNIHYCGELVPIPKLGKEFIRTISAWGDKKQADISRLRVGVVGIGSVGSLIVEALHRSGIPNITLIDFDLVERKNLDRLHGVSRKSIGRLKVGVYKERLSENQLGLTQDIRPVPYSISEKEGLLAALDCDILFSCVDRPLARYILNHLSYANLIPVIEGGIEASINKHKTNIDQARWRTFAISPQRRCLRCHGQYLDTDVGLEMEGLFDDPKYIQGLDNDHFINRGENVFAFSLSLTGMQMQQFLSIILQPKGFYYGAKEMCFVTGNTDDRFQFSCDDNCDFEDKIALGDAINETLKVDYPLAQKCREKLGLKDQKKINKQVRIWTFIKSFFH